MWIPFVSASHNIVPQQSSGFLQNGLCQKCLKRTARFKNPFSIFSAKREEIDTAVFIITSPVGNSNDVIYKINDVANVPIYSRLKQDFLNIFLQATL